MARSNDEIAGRLDEMAAVLAAQSANPFRVRAYRRAAETLRRLPTPASQILETHGAEGLDRLRAIGPKPLPHDSRHRRSRYSPILERLRGESDPVRLFESVPGIGPLLAARLYDELGLETLHQLETAAYDRRLEQIAGFGPKRLGGIRFTDGTRAPADPAHRTRRPSLHSAVLEYGARPPAWPDARLGGAVLQRRSARASVDDHHGRLWSAAWSADRQRTGGRVRRASIRRRARRTRAPIQELLHRIKWDLQFGRGEFAHGIVHHIPLHRVRTVSKDGIVIRHVAGPMIDSL